jgi:transposase-like protein
VHAITLLIEELMNAEINAFCVVNYGERSRRRQNGRKGYRIIIVDTQIGAIRLRMPQLSRGRYGPDWLFELRTQSTSELSEIAAQCCSDDLRPDYLESITNHWGIDNIRQWEIPFIVRRIRERLAEHLNSSVEAPSLMS